jgi:Tol biopolymer transport system component
MNRRFLAFTLVLAVLITAPVAKRVAAEDSATENIVFVRRGNIWVADIAGKTERKLTDSGICGGPALSPDGQQVVFHCRGEKDIHSDTGFGQIYLAEIKGGEPRRLNFKGILAAEHPAFSPDGKSLVFVGLSEINKQKAGGYVQVFATMSISIADIKTGKIRDLLRHQNTMLDAGYVYSNPVFSPDGRLVLWQHSGSDVSGGFSIIDLKGETVFQFPPEHENSTPYWRPSLSHDGRKVLCYTPAISDTSADTIYFVDRAAGKMITVTNGANPVFVNNETAIVFESWGNRWSEAASSNLWFLELVSGSAPKRILLDAEQPASIIFRK